MSNQSEINRNNAKYSTGPKTVAGKQHSSQNALRHGLTAQTVVMPNESLDAYRAHLESFVDEYRPQGATETQLVQSLADTSWRLNRVASFEADLLTRCAVRDVKPAKFSDDEDQRIQTVTRSFESQSKALANLSLHTQRLSREFERTVAQLRKLQETRPAEERKEPEKTTNPPKDGFVFTEPQIARDTQARTRDSLTPKAPIPPFHDER